jgi:hypothetical protein
MLAMAHDLDELHDSVCKTEARLAPAPGVRPRGVFLFFGQREAWALYEVRC